MDLVGTGGVGLVYRRAELFTSNQVAIERKVVDEKDLKKLSEGGKTTTEPPVNGYRSS